MTRDAELERAGDELANAFFSLWTGLFAIKPHLDKPYPEDGRWTPWTRFVEQELARAEHAADAWRAARIDRSPEVT